MKQLILFILCTVSFNYVNAQALSAKDLLDMVECDKFNCVKTKAENKFYKVTMNKERNGYNVYSFNSKTTYKNSSNPNLVAPYQLVYTQRPGDSSVAVNYTVGDEEQRQLLLSEFEGMGFEYFHATKTESTDDNVATVYKSEQHPDLRLKITNYQKTFEKTKQYLEYNFEIIRMVKAKQPKEEDNPLKVVR